jgi:thioredoxin
MSVRAVTADELVHVPGPVVIKFWATWCGPCRAYAPQFETALAGRDGVTAVQVDVDDEPELAARFGVRSIPHTVLVVDGREVAAFSGARPATGVNVWLDEHLPADPVA